MIGALNISGCTKDDNAPKLPSIDSFTPTRAAIGAKVEISGTNFGDRQGSSLVKFNGVVANVISYSSSRIEAIVPDGATTGPISVTVGEASAESNEAFQVLVPLADDPDFYFGADLSYVSARVTTATAIFLAARLRSPDFLLRHRVSVIF